MLTLRSRALDLVVAPARGAQIVSIRESARGRELLLQLPADPRRACAGDSMEQFFAAYRGGWQMLCPNAGAAREGPDGVRWDFHGEACRASWDAREIGPGSVHCATGLASAPLTLERTVTVVDTTVRVEQRICNHGDETITVAWVEHPAFGAPLVGPGCRLSTNAGRFSPAAGMPAPHELARVPDTGGPAVLLGTLTEFDEAPRVSLRNSQAGLGVELRWSPEHLPHAWLWQEQGATTGYPWYGEVTAFAIEPASTSVDGDPRVDGLRLPPGQSREGWVEVSLESFPGAVRRRAHG